MTHFDCLQLFAFVFLLPQFLSTIIFLVSIVLPLHPLSALTSFSILWVLCTQRCWLGSSHFHNITLVIFKTTPPGVWYTPIIFLPISWNILLFFRSSSINFRFSSVSCSLRFRASASRSAFDRNFGWKVMTDVWDAAFFKRRQKGLNLKTSSPWPLLPLLLSFLQEVLPEIKVGPVQKHQSIN